MKGITMNSIAIDLGGTHTKIGLLENGVIKDFRTLEAYSTGRLADQLQVIEKELFGMSEKRGWQLNECRGIGFAYPGIVNPKTKKIVSASGKYTDGPSFDLENWCSKVFGLPMVLENDANAALFGEHQYGCAKEYDSAVLMTLGTGIGTAVIMEGKLLRGKHFQAGCLGGHFITSIHGTKCLCGGAGCLETDASTWALPDIVRSTPGFFQSGLAKESVIDFLSLYNWAERGERFATTLLNQCIDYWSAGVVDLIHAYDPEIVVMSGGVMKGQDLILPLLSQNVRQWAWTPWGEVRIKVAEHPEYSVLLGLHTLIEENR
jgi:glucokinase